MECTLRTARSPMFILLLCAIASSLFTAIGAQHVDLQEATTIAAAATAGLHERSLRQYSLYNVSPFGLDFTSSGSGTFLKSDDERLSLKKTFVDVTEEYLKDFIAAEILQSETSLGDLHSVDFQAAVQYSLDDNSGNSALYLSIKSEIYGTVAIYDPMKDGDVLSPEDMRVFLDSFLENAFQQKAMKLYTQRLEESSNPVLQNIETIAVELNIEATLEPPKIPQGIDGNDSGKRWDMTDFFVCFSVGAFLAFALGFMYFYISRDYHQRIDKQYMLAHKEGRLPESSTVDEDEDEGDGQMKSNPANRRRLLASPRHGSELTETIQSNSDPNFNGAGGNSDILPVPADEQTIQGTVSRRYLSPASPYEVLYGATFLHQDKELVERAKRERKKQKYIAKTHRKHIKPMLSIAESETDFGSNNSWRKNVPIATWLKQVAESYIPSSLSPNKPSSNGDIVQPKLKGGGRSPTAVSDFPCTYRDFPRHDGTPCLMYTPDTKLEDNKWGSSLLPLPLPESDEEEVIESRCLDDILEEGHEVVRLNENSCHSTDSARSAGPYAPQVDTFVSKLENLMVMKKRQYQERMNQEKERAAFKAKMQERRKNRKVEQVASESALSATEEETEVGMILV